MINCGEGINLVLLGSSRNVLCTLKNVDLEHLLDILPNHL